jgi:hypothetical protein
MSEERDSTETADATSATRMAGGAVELLRSLRRLRGRRGAGSVSDDDYQAMLRTLSGPDAVGTPDRGADRARE